MTGSRVGGYTFTRDWDTMKEFMFHVFHETGHLHRPPPECMGWNSYSAPESDRWDYAAITACQGEIHDFLFRKVPMLSCVEEDEDD